MSQEEGEVMVSSRQRFQTLSRRERLQRRIDQLVESSTQPYARTRVDSYEEAKLEALRDGEDVQDANPIGNSDVAAAIAEAFRRGHQAANVAGHPTLTPPPQPHGKAMT
jgi:hypothetical protein